MLRLGRSLKNLVKPIHNLCRNYQVSIVGSSHPIERTLSMLLKPEPLISRLTMFDVPDHTPGLAMDVSHVPSKTVAEGFTDMELALRRADIAVIAGGQPRRIDQDDHGLFLENAESVVTAAQAIATHCPSAFVVVMTEPINHTVALTHKVLETSEKYDKYKVFGVTGVPVMRTQSCIASMYQIPQVSVPVVCGASSETIVPLFSHIKPNINVDYVTAAIMTDYIRNIESQIISLKCGVGCPTLSSAFAGYCTVSAILNALNGNEVEHIAFVPNNDYGTKYFAVPVIITKNGISAIIQYNIITELEANYINIAAEQLKKDVNEGERYFNPSTENPRYVKCRTKIY